MTELTFNDPCVLFALGRESRSFREEFRPQQRFPGAPCWARFVAPTELPLLTVLMLETGVGSTAVEKAMQWVLGGPVLENVPYRPKMLLYAGFSGALQEGLHVGDIILATEVVDTTGQRWPTTWPPELPPGEWRPPLHRGRVLTVPNIVETPDEKRRLGQQHDAVCCDMESAVVARSCAQRGIPFGCVRAISDDLHAPLSPRLASLLRGGRVSLLRLLTALIVAPRLAGEMWRLAGQTRFAAGQLGTALGELLTLTLPWTSDR